MARAYKKHPSKRRAAALKFLSNISFENIVSPEEITYEQTVYVENESTYNAQGRKDGSDTVQELVISKNVEVECLAPSFGPFRERSYTASSDIIRHNDAKHRKIPIDENLPSLAYSSTESITSISGKQRANFNQRMQKMKQMKITNANNLKNCKNERIMLLSSATKVPFYVFSFLPYKKVKSKGENKKETGSRRRNLSGSRPLSSFIDTLDPFVLLGLERFEVGQMISYQQLLHPSIPLLTEEKEPNFIENTEAIPENSLKNFHVSRCLSVDTNVSSKSPQTSSSSPPFTEFRANDWEEFGYGNSSPLPYSPFLLDDPELMSGKHRIVLTFPSYRASVIDYVRPSELKKELNEKFKEKFPYIQLTLSKLRSLKKEMKSVSKTEKCVDLLTVAQSYVYFEKLILRNVVNKTNRKVCVAVCLLLSAKMNDIKGVAIKHLLEKLESIFRLSRKDILASEFAVVVALEFGLHVPTWEILPHFQRLSYES